MKVEPGARELLEAARAALVNEVIPLLPADKRYAALMAANAMAISIRELSLPATEAGERGRLAALLGQPASDPIAEANRTLAARIREGAFDQGSARAALLGHLEATTRERLAVSNPRALRPPQEKP
ncbi:MAG: hypothetical protein IPL06_12880 [Betaproteobacteria bacterium]|nr:hypothetical protein [Betaproteobacteria bacterium]